MRTALGQFSFALIILKIFTSDFYPIGALFAVYGTAIMLVAVYRRYEGNRQFFDQQEAGEEYFSESDGAGGTVRRVRKTVIVHKKFRTSGNSIALLMVLSLSSYVVLLVLLWHLVS